MTKITATQRKQDFDIELARMAGADLPPRRDLSEEATASFKADLARMAVGQKPRSPMTKSLPSSRFASAEHARGLTMCATFPADWTFDDVLKPDTWRLLASHLTVGAKIEVRNDALTWYGELLVVVSDRSRGLVEVVELMRKDLPQAQTTGDDTGEFVTKYAGLTDRWIIQRVSDGKLMKTGLPSRSEAIHEIRTMTPRPLGQ